MWRYWALISLVTAVAAGTTRGQTEWLLPDYPARILFTVSAPAGRQVLLPIASDDMVPRPTAFVAFDPARQPIPCRLVFSNAANAWLLIETDIVEKRHPYTVYCGTPGSPDVSAPPMVPDPAPVSVQFAKFESKAVPLTWDQMRYLYKNAGKKHQLQYVTSFQALANNAHPGAGGLMVMRATVLCRRSGTYGFMIDDANAAFLLIDGEMATSCSDQAQPTPRRTNDTVSLVEGPHLFEIFRSHSRANTGLRLLWRRPDDAGFAPIPDESLLTAHIVHPIRRENIDKTLHASFTFRKDQAYSFLKRATVFTPVKFKAASVNWLTTNLQTRWDFGDGAEDVGESVEHVYAGLNRYRVTMEVRDRLGFVSRCSALVDCRQEIPSVLPFSATVTMLPAVCYPTDAVEPAVRVAGDLSPAMAMELTWDIQALRGSSENKSRTLSVGREAQSVVLLKGPAGEFAGVRWRITHCAAVVASGAIDFSQPPFGTAPWKIDGDGLATADGARLALVPIEHRGIVAQPPIEVPSNYGRIVCLDDSLAAPGYLLDTNYPTYDRMLADLIARPGAPRFAYLPLMGFDSDMPEAQTTLAWLTCAAEKISTNELYILSLGLNAMLTDQEPGIFERQLAALCDLITISKRSAVLLVTPPPYPQLVDRIRQYAVAIKRVADARCIPIADLFTAFKGQDDDAPPLFATGFLGPTAAGQNLAARIIAAAFHQPAEKERP